MFHNATAVQVTLSKGTLGDYFSTHWGLVVGVTMGIHWGWGVSGESIGPYCNKLKSHLITFTSLFYEGLSSLASCRTENDKRIKVSQSHLQIRI